MKKWLTFATILLFISFSIGLAGQDTDIKAKLDEYLHQLEKHNKAMGGVLISQNGKTMYEKAIGFSSLEDQTRNNKFTRFKIGSISKIFTAAMIFQLIEEGKVSLETKLAQYYPQIPNSKEITISDLLSHRSGIHNFTNDPKYLQYMTSKQSKDDMIKRIADLAPDFQPGEKFTYSNSNYILLGYIIEKICHSPYAEELKKRICARVNLGATYYGGVINTKANEAFSYSFTDKQWVLQPETDMSIPHGAGAIVSTPSDLAVFITALFNHKLLSEASLKQMQEIRDGTGRGLIRFPFADKVAYGHNGGIDGFVANVAYFPFEKLAVAVTTNSMNYNFNDMLIGILSIYFKLPFEIPDLAAPDFKLSHEELEKYQGEYSSTQLPLKISLKVEDGQLFGQATGQSAFPLTPFSETEFRFESAGIIIEFAKDSDGAVQTDAFILNQGGQKFSYKRL